MYVTTIMENENKYQENRVYQTSTEAVCYEDVRKADPRIREGAVCYED